MIQMFLTKEVDCVSRGWKVIKEVCRNGKVKQRKSDASKLRRNRKDARRVGRSTRAVMGLGTESTGAYNNYLRSREGEEVKLGNLPMVSLEGN